MKIIICFKIYIALLSVRPQKLCSTDIHNTRKTFIPICIGIIDRGSLLSDWHTVNRPLFVWWYWCRDCSLNDRERWGDIATDRIILTSSNFGGAIFHFALLLSSNSHTDVHSFLNIRSSVCYTMQLELVVHIVPIVRRFGGPFSQAVVSPSTAFNYYSLPFLTNSSSA